MIQSPKYGKGLHSRLCKTFQHVKEELRKQSVRRIYDMRMGFQGGYGFADNIYHLISRVFRSNFIPLGTHWFINYGEYGRR
jgi:hypothetical protein